MLLQGKRVACLVGDDYEDLEVWYPVLRLQEEGATVDLIGLKANEPCRGKHGYPATSALGIGEVKAAQYDALIVPGGWMPDKLRRYPAILDFCQEFDRAGKVIATICHGPWILISARLLEGRTLTSTPGIKDDVTNAGAEWVDLPAVRDGNLISARRPPDLPDFCRLIIQAMQE
ncbi:MAG TPA: type 1 glutamine amidotransferase domain-containing protein [Symbiobacteriaceae bacterium]|nr:type 1 glutamine amidotransferase domain-containing protein [Symbiobacteriaceae bacterium]